MAEKIVKRYFRDHDHDELIVRVWYDENKNRRGEYWWVGKSDKWSPADELAWMVADEIYENHPLSEEMVGEIIGEKVE